MTDINTIYLRLKKPSDENAKAFIALLEQHFSIFDIRVQNIETPLVAARIIQAHIDVIATILLVLALFLVGIATMGLFSGISANLSERRREFAVLRALGGSTTALALIVGSEVLFTTLAGWLIAQIIAQPASYLLAQFFGHALVDYPFDFLASSIAPAISLGLCVGMAMLASAVSVGMMAKSPLAVELNYE